MKHHRPLRILITGASSGIGKACAQALSDARYQVYGTSRKDVSNRNGESLFKMCTLDITSDASVTSCIKEIMQDGGIDVLVNNAGFGIAGAAEETGYSEALEQFETNYFGTMRMCNAVLPYFRAQGHGRIITISSIAAKITIPFQSQYCATKAALESYMGALRYEVRPFGIHVSLIEPGDFKTDFTAHRQHTQASDLSSSPYAATFKRVLGVMEHDETHGANPTAVAQCVVRTLNAEHPKLRYMVGPSIQKFAVRLQNFLPQGIFEKLIGLYYKV